MSERGDVVNGNGTTDMSADRQQQIEEFGKRQHIAEEGMRRGKALVYRGGAVFAKFAHFYIDGRLWEREYASLSEALAQPGIRMSEKHAKNLALVYRTLVVERKVPFEELEEVDWRTLQIGIPAITSSKDPKPWQDVVGDAKVLGRDEMRLRYMDKRGPDAPLDATAEPERMPCPMCGSFVDKDRIPEDEREAA